MATQNGHSDNVQPGDIRIGNRIVHVKSGVAALRSVRLGLIHLAYALADDRHLKGVLVLTDTSITRRRLGEEWQQALSVLRPDVAERLALIVSKDGNLTGFPRDPDAQTRTAILEATGGEQPRIQHPRIRLNASFIVAKVLMLQWLTDGRPMTVRWLSRVTGFSYPSVAHVLKELGSLIERRSDRRFRLRYFPKEEFTRLLSVAPRARATVRFADRSGQSRTIEAHIRRLEKLNPSGVAIGGAAGAKYYSPDLDIVGVPRLDLSLHSPLTRPDLSFIERLDPALKRVTDSQEPATIAVHLLSQADPFYAPRKGGLSWADPMECLMDLAEAGLQKQAAQFLEVLMRKKQEKR
jgi:hypothetical protein